MDKHKYDFLKPHKEHPHMIVCEGMDCKMFFLPYIEYLVRQQLIPDEYEAFDYGGNGDINKYLPLTTKQDEFSFMKSMLIVRDAEQDVGQAVASLQGVLRDVFAVEVPDTGDFVYSDQYAMKIGFYLWPGLQNGRFHNGTLENTCCALLHKGQDELDVGLLGELAGNYLASIQSHHGEFKRAHKNRLHAILSGTDHFVGMKIGEAAKAGAFNYSGADLSDLTRRIIEMSAVAH